MKKRIVTVLSAVWLVNLCACSSLQAGPTLQSEDVKRIEKDPVPVSAEPDRTADESGGMPETGRRAESDVNNKGLYYPAETEKGSVDVYMDMPIQTVLDSLGEPDEYYEAKSCAFDGLDKMYTYQHFEIDTWPGEDGDYVSAVFLLDDLTGTAEGLFVGADAAEADEKYGTDFDASGNERIYEVDGMKLKLQITDGKISYITYESGAFGNVAGQ